MDNISFSSIRIAPVLLATWLAKKSVIDWHVKNEITYLTCVCQILVAQWLLHVFFWYYQFWAIQWDNEVDLLVNQSQVPPSYVGIDRKHHFVLHKPWTKNLPELSGLGYRAITKFIRVKSLKCPLVPKIDQESLPDTAEVSSTGAVSHRLAFY